MESRTKPKDGPPFASSGGWAAAERLRNEVAVTEAKDSALAQDIITVCDLLARSMEEMNAAYDHLSEGTSQWEFDALLDTWKWEPPNRKIVPMPLLNDEPYVPPTDPAELEEIERFNEQRRARK